MSNTATVITTKAGEALIAKMQAENKVLVIDKFIFANVPNRPAFPNRDDAVPTEHVVHESAVHEQGRLTENSVIYSTTLASHVGPFSFNWSGLFCSEHNVLVAINFPPPVDKTVDEPGITGNTLVRSFVLEYKGIAETTNITVDPSSWQYDAHKRMSKMDNDTAQAIIDQNGKDWFIDDGFIVTPQSNAYSIKAGAGYVSGHRISLDFDRIIQVPEKPAFIYVDAFREGSPTGEWVTKFNFVVSPDEKDDYTDDQSVQHFVCKIAQVMGDGSVSMLRKKDKVGDYVGSINNLHTTRDAIEWRPNLKVKTKDALQLFSHTDEYGVKSYYLPNVDELPFVTSADFYNDIEFERFNEDVIITDDKLNKKIESIHISLQSFFDLKKDAGEAIRRAIDFYSNKLEIITLNLDGLAGVVRTNVNFPPDKKIIIKNGKLDFLGGELNRVTTKDDKKCIYPVIFSDLIICNAIQGGACIMHNSAWQDDSAGGGIIVEKTCSFILTNGAVGLRMGRSFFNSIEGSFDMDENSCGILFDQNIDDDKNVPQTCFETSLGKCSFRGGRAIDCIANDGEWNTFEGLKLTDQTFFYSSKIYLKKYNGLDISKSHLVSSFAVLDSGYGTRLTGIYADKIASTEPLLTIKTTLRDFIGLQIDGGCEFNAQQMNGNLILFTDEGSKKGASISNVNMGTAYFVGGDLDSRTIYAVNFNHENMRNFNGSGNESFNGVNTCYYFSKPIWRSTINRFEARDVLHYALNAETCFPDKFNRFDSLYRVTYVSMLETNTNTSVEEIIGKQRISVEMQRPPVLSIGSQESAFGDFYIKLSDSYEDHFYVELWKNYTENQVKRAGADCTLVLDAQEYISPR